MGSATAAKDQGFDMESFYQSYRKNGFHFSDEILTNYALSLATKPFVILCGISGTGKSKIAQLFSIPVPDDQRDQRRLEESESTTLRPDGFVTLTISGGLWQDGYRANFRYADVGYVLSPDDAERIEAQRQCYLKNNSDDGNFTDTYEVSIDTGDPVEPQIRVGVYFQRASSPLFRIRFRSRQGVEPEWNSFDFLRRKYQPGDVVRFERIGDRHLRITPADEEAIAVAQTNREAEIRSLDTTCFIPVRSNWVDSSELVGYYNQLTGKYQMTKVLKFLLQASDYPEVPHFLILDEMNLSKVEHYFSDFLSCIESRHVVDGRLRQESITLHIGDNRLATSDDYYDEIAQEIQIPTNLYITGTVNVDDSTQPISPKVLDRANLIEFNEVHLNEFDTGGYRLESFPDFRSPKQPSIQQLNEVPRFVKENLEELINILRPENLHFGYRTVAEISCFILNAIACMGIDRNDAAQYALDVQILQKILPKFNGSVAKIGRTLLNLILYLSDSTGEIKQLNPDDINTIESNLSHSQYPRSLRKAIHMYRKVNEQGFVNFIE